MSTPENMMTKSEVGPFNIATISAGFEKGDFLVREEQGNRVYFDFFEEVCRRRPAERDRRRSATTLPLTPLPASFAVLPPSGLQLHLKQGLLAHDPRG
jgi:hypothetical protein